MSGAAARPRLAGILIALAGLLVAARGIAGWSGMERAIEVGQRREVPPRVFGSGRLAERLAALGTLHPRPYDATGHAPSATGRRGPALWSLDPLASEDLPSSRQVPAERIATGNRIVSLTLPDDDWRALLADPGRRGRETERPGYATIWENGRVSFATGVGVRLHGGRSRFFSPRKSLRLYFHRSYGAPALPAAVQPWPDAVPLHDVVLHNDVREDAAGMRWQFASPLAYDLARQAGGLAPRTAPAWVYVNGELQGLYFLTERLDLDYVESHYGHRDFLLLRTKRDQGADRFQSGNPDLFKFLRLRIAKAPRLTVDGVADEIAVDPLLRWAVTVLFCATTDAFQGPLLRDLTDPSGRWFWIGWDMDHSFMSQKAVIENPWEQDAFEWLVRGRHPDLRAILLRRLAQEDETFPARFRALSEQVLEERLTDEFLAERLAYYEGVADAYALEDRAFLPPLREFIVRRREVFRRQLDTYFPATAVTTPAAARDGAAAGAQPAAH